MQGEPSFPGLPRDPAVTDAADYYGVSHRLQATALGLRPWHSRWFDMVYTLKKPVRDMIMEECVRFQQVTLVPGAVSYPRPEWDLRELTYSRFEEWREILEGGIGDPCDPRRGTPIEKGCDEVSRVPYQEQDLGTIKGWLRGLTEQLGEDFPWLSRSRGGCGYVLAGGAIESMMCLVKSPFCPPQIGSDLDLFWVDTQALTRESPGRGLAVPGYP
ncbi:hypothetical protein GPECTOR_1598g744 [Gonium pectorale]|uniref:Uncharacterized protein n=1 Tax=Gonium pectorale TaxID=33097 RepID=A0A150FTH3_GONPE|nr:hypothetical protein GPECTOR_1598g744 [Gonium pectorale]|eukprot:KXZ40878.1 hypothetical protein GPECTOR_1598g744 [Gonium pectorale]